MPPNPPSGSQGGVPSGRRHVLHLAVAGAVLLAALLAASKLAALSRAGWPQQPRAWVDLDEPEPGEIRGHDPNSRELGIVSPDFPADRLSLRFAIAPVIASEKSLEGYGRLLEDLAYRVGRTPVFLRGRSHSEINGLLRNGRCDVALVSAYSLVRGEREFGLKALVVPQIKGELTYHSLILVNAATPASSLLELRGKRFASADLFSTSGWLFPALWLKEHGEDPNLFFGEHLITGSYDRALQAVASGYVDGAAVYSLLYDQIAEADPTLAAKVKVILKSEPIGMPPLVVSPQDSAELRQAVLVALLGLHEGPAGRQILAPLGIERFVAAGDQLYDSVRKAVDRWESRKPQRGFQPLPNPKLEIQNPKETPNSKTEKPCAAQPRKACYAGRRPLRGGTECCRAAGVVFPFRACCFLRISNFEFRVSD